MSPPTSAMLAAQRAGLVPSGAFIDGSRFTAQSRSYLIATCRCGFEGCPGWAVVSDQPEAIAYHRRLFCEDAAPPPARPAERTRQPEAAL